MLNLQSDRDKNEQNMILLVIFANKFQNKPLK